MKFHISSIMKITLVVAFILMVAKASFQFGLEYDDDFRYPENISKIYDDAHSSGLRAAQYRYLNWSNHTYATDDSVQVILTNNDIIEGVVYIYPKKVQGYRGYHIEMRSQDQSVGNHYTIMPPDNLKYGENGPVDVYHND